MSFTKFRRLIREQTGITLREGKQIMLASRLNRRLRAHGIGSFSEYYDFLTGPQAASGEMVEFINAVTTNKTSFFREAHHFEFLAKTVVADAHNRIAKGSPQTLRVWSAASSTGEEPYSIATTLLDAVPQGWSIKVEASDIDTDVLDTAQSAVYPASALDGIDPAFCRRHFLRGKADMAGMVCLKPEVRRIVDFRRINLVDTTWPVEGGLDAIFFRNALIYFERDMQERFLRRMVRLLRPTGYLFLGHSEHVPWLYDVVKPLSNTVFQVRNQGPQGDG